MARVLLFGFVLVFTIAVHATTLADSRSVHLKYVNKALEKGAVCLDGSPAAYYHDKGVGDGRHNWVIYLQGGGWCSNHTDCKNRSTSGLGTSTRFNKTLAFDTPFFNNNSSSNPEFYNWNRVFVPYCDGSSFTGNKEAVDPVTNVTYRGFRIFEATMDDLMSKGMKNAQNAILSGGSAGGLAAMIHCDRFRDLLPITARVKCLAIASYFVHEAHLDGSKQFEAKFEGLISLHGSSKALPPLCTSRMNPSLCFFPQYFLPTIRTPVFIAMSSFDRVQIRYNLCLEDEVCLLHNNCTHERLKAMQDLRHYVLSKLPKACPSQRGVWITSCIAHDLPSYWKTTYGKVLSGWFIDGSYTQVIEDSEIPRNCSSEGISPI
ncbi:unnamed protein product [Cuscuta epithymum]|uniref:Pectin acetylesterase n=1 Tax=Cuscuta epithymum TaxID=186058 RepID=A0AAV0C8V4_9ASTE|nr:unnamed protein product [Cuscuta epithymum]CAH9071529.1 unnamed protein product [Cuscuta epithymum]CAH9071531.1 unnamed protein product [Cuscuta epithymum]